MTDAHMELVSTHAHVHDDHDHHMDPALEMDNAKFATWLYIGSEVMIFTGMLVGYIIFRVYQPEVVKQVHEHMSLLLVSINTFILLASSWMMVMGLNEIKKNNPRGLMQWVSGTVILGAVFVGLQVVEYAELLHAGVTLTGDTEFAAFGMRFYAPTAFHGAHVVVGVLWGIWLLNKAYRGKFSADKYIGVEIFGLYWHFVDVVWIVLFTVIYLI